MITGCTGVAVVPTTQKNVGASLLAMTVVHSALLRADPPSIPKCCWLMESSHSVGQWPRQKRGDQRCNLLMDHITWASAVAIPANDAIARRALFDQRRPAGFALGHETEMAGIADLDIARRRFGQAFGQVCCNRWLSGQETNCSYAVCRRMVRMEAPKQMNVEPTTRLTQRDSSGRVITPLAREASEA